MLRLATVLRHRKAGFKANAMGGMVHGHTKEECINILQTMSESVNVREYDYLFSEKEYKKVRLRYFV